MREDASRVILISNATVERCPPDTQTDLPRTVGSRGIPRCNRPRIQPRNPHRFAGALMPHRVQDSAPSAPRSAPNGDRLTK